MNCKNCNTEIDSKFCPDCGQPISLKRIDGHYIAHEIEHVLHFERGILYTIRGLLTNPGQNIKNYLNESRTRLVKPIIFIIITSLVYSIIIHFFHLEDGYIKYFDKHKTTVTTLFKWVQEHYGYANIMMGVFIALWLKLFFRKHNYNIYEILILLCFIIGIGMLLYAIFGIIQGLTHLNVLQLGGMVGFIYTIWAIGQFFDKRKIMSYVKAFFAYLLGMLSFMLTIVIIGVLTDLIMKH